MIPDTNFSRYKIEKSEKWREWGPRIPYVSFPEKYQVKIIPPYSGAMVRFLVRNPKTDESVSVYLDVYSRLGCYDGQDTPYWEVYPDIDGDTFRTSIDNTKELIDQIKIILK